jgi:hypothetical protein
MTKVHDAHELQRSLDVEFERIYGLHADGNVIGVLRFQWLRFHVQDVRLGPREPSAADFLIVHIHGPFTDELLRRRGRKICRSLSRMNTRRRSL